MADLASGRFAESNPLWNILGNPTNVINPSYPARTNLEYTGIQTLADTAASLVTQVMTAVPIPVDVGMTVSKISVLVGATPAGTPTNSFVALYSGTNVAAPPLIGQSTDITSGAIAASARFDWSLTAPATITAAQAPYGYVWAAIMSKATTVPSLVTTATGAAAGQYQWFTNTLSSGTNTAFCISSGSALTGTAPATLVYASQKTTAPVVFLT